MKLRHRRQFLHLVAGTAARSMGRRQLVTLLGGIVAALPLRGSQAQPANRKRRIGALISIANDEEEGERRVSAFVGELATLGWVDSDIEFHIRWAAGDLGQLAAYASELSELKPDVFLANGTPALTELRRAAQDRPIVFVQIADPISTGFVSNLPRPGGNITGFTNYDSPMAGKWLQTLKEIAPEVDRVICLVNSNNAALIPFVRAIEGAAFPFSIKVLRSDVFDAGQIEQTFRSYAKSSRVGLVVMPDLIATMNRQLIVELALQNRHPGVYPFRSFAIAGGLISYGVDVADQYRRAASYVNRILRGEKAGDLPIQQPTKFEWVINLKTAKALDLAIPRTLIARADELIE
jgi:putative ABC transport system substrate-binding protein